MMSYLNILLVHTSCLINAIFAGHRYEMLSSRAYRSGIIRSWKARLHTRRDWSAVAQKGVEYSTFPFWIVINKIIDTILGGGHCRACYEFERDNFEGIQD